MFAETVLLLRVGKNSARIIPKPGKDGLPQTRSLRVPVFREIRLAKRHVPLPPAGCKTGIIGPSRLKQETATIRKSRERSGCAKLPANRFHPTRT